MTDKTPTPVDPARVLAVLQVLGWPDDRVEAAGDPEGYSNALTGVHWELAEEVVRAVDAASPDHLIEFGPGRWALQHPRSCYPDVTDCQVWRVAEPDLAPGAGSLAPHGLYECSVNDLGDRLLIGDRIDLPEASNG